MLCETVLGEAICDQMERLKWSLWHGQVDKALGEIDVEAALQQEFFDVAVAERVP